MVRAAALRNMALSLAKAFSIGLKSGLRDGGQQGVEAVVERQQGVTTEGDDDRLLLCRERGGTRLGGPGAPIGNISSRAPFGDGLGVYPVASGQVPHCLETVGNAAASAMAAKTR